MYGQTGSGKTYTMLAVNKFAADDMFSLIEEDVVVSVSVLELQGDYVYDLLNNRERVHIREDNRGNVKICGNKEMIATSAKILDDITKKAYSERMTQATKINSVSSRTHCFTRIYLRVPSKKNSDKKILYGLMTLVDLAGSERNSDSMYHNKERRKESAAINTSLMSLKDCMRILAENERKGVDARIPYRANKLTMILKDVFTSKTTKVCCFLPQTVVIGTCSPSSTDTEHTINTLKHICLMIQDRVTVNQSTMTATDYNKAVYIKSKITHPSQWDSESMV